MRTPPPKAIRHLVVAGVLVFIAVNLLWYARRVPFFHEEARRALVAQEMLLTGNYVVPTSYMVPYYKKPPLQNWLIAWLSRPAGVVSQFSARAVSVAALLTTALAVYLFLLRRNPDLALPAFLIVATNELMACEYGNKVEPDMLITAMTTMAFLFYLAGPTRPATLVPSALCLGLGMLAKGLSPLYFYPPVLLYISTRSDRRAKRLAWLAAHAALALLLPALWLWQYHLHGDLSALLHAFAGEASARHTRAITGFVKHLFSFPFKVILVLVPWSLMTAYAFHRPRTRDETYAVALTGFLFALLVFAFLPAGRSRYLMPAIPLFAIAAAHHLDPDKEVHRGVRLAAGLTLAGLCIGLAGHLLPVHAYAQSGLLLGTGLLAPWLLWRVHKTLPWGALAALTIILAYMHGLYFYRTIDQFNYAARARQLIADMKEPLPVVVDDDRNPKWISFYLEAQMGRPVYSKTRAGFQRYYYVTIPKDGSPRFGWQLQLLEGAP